MADKNRATYQRHMEAGYNAAWEQDWPTAIKEYTRAIQIIPEDPEAHIQLGLALLTDDQLENALKIFKRAQQLSPDDPVPLERSADALERMGRLQEAAQQYVNVAEVYLAQRDLDKAIANWSRATRLTPGLVSVHARLAQAFERTGEKTEAIREYLTLAFNFKRLDDADKAIKSVERALRIDKRNRHALNMLRALRTGAEVILPQWEDEGKEAPQTGETGRLDFSWGETAASRDEVGESDPMGPLGEAMSNALVMLAGHVVESGLDAYGGEAMQAMEFQRQSLHKEAAAAYLRAVPGLEHPSLKLNLGCLLLLTNEPKKAIDHLEEAAQDPALAAGALHALGQAYFKLNEQKNAARNLIQSLQAVDTSLAINEAEVAELVSVYNSLLTALEGRTDEVLTAVNERFMGLLTGKDWKQRIAETRRHLDETLKDEGGQGALELIVAKGSDEITQSVSRIDGYIRQGLFTLAMDEAHRAVEKSPLYLPVHVRMAEVMMKEGRVRQAINKFNMVARCYLVRDERNRAASILNEVLEMAPLDITVRTSLIELLEKDGRWEEALDQYIDLANTYQQLGDFDNARETYEESEKIAKRVNAAPEKQAIIKHSLADIAQMRLNMRQAQKLYEEVIEIMPSDEKALKALVDLHYSQNNQVEAIKRLDMLLGVYAKNSKINRITKLLEDLVKYYPNETGLRSRLASTYIRLGRNREAIEQLDALGELQLDAGLNQEAADTIRQIINLEPDRLDAYERLLSQLGG